MLLLLVALLGMLYSVQIDGTAKGLGPRHFRVHHRTSCSKDDRCRSSQVVGEPLQGRDVSQFRTAFREYLLLQLCHKCGRKAEGGHIDMRGNRQIGVQQVILDQFDDG